jgi:hypothetical protein
MHIIVSHQFTILYFCCETANQIVLVYAKEERISLQYPECSETSQAVSSTIATLI